MNETLIRFAHKVKIRKNACWEWKGERRMKNKTNYSVFTPLFKKRGKSIAAHRFIYEETIGSIPRNRFLKRKCETIYCVNPAHFELVRSAKQIIPIEARFMEKVKKGKTNCWRWLGQKNSEGYGGFRTEKGSQLAHRVAYQLFVGPIPEGLLVCHKCDNPSCVNPSHLFIGTDSDNSYDKVKKLRHTYGINTHCAKLVPQLVKKIREEHKQSGLSQRKLAKKYGLSSSAMWQLLKRNTWKHVE